jgi:hypothetical protein
MNHQETEIAIWEDNFKGHTLAFVEILVRHIFEKTKKPVLFFSSRTTFQSKPYRIYLKPLEGRFIPVVVGEKFSEEKMPILWHRFRKIEKELSTRGIRRLVLSTADSVVKTLGMARLAGWKPKNLDIHCCLLYLGIVYPDRGGITRLRDRFSFWLKNLAPVKSGYLDQWAVKKIREQMDITLDVCPEPLFSLGGYLKQRTLRKHADTGKGLCFGFFGGARLGDTKGAELLLDAFIQANLPSDSKLVFAGPFNEKGILDKISQIQAKLGDRFRMVNGYLEVIELFKEVDQVDVVCLPYRSHVGTSAFFAQAATLGKVILSTDYGWLGWAGSQYNKTVFFKNDSMHSLASSLEKAGKEFAELDSRKSNYTPIPEEDFVKALTDL